MRYRGFRASTTTTTRSCRHPAMSRFSKSNTTNFQRSHRLRGRGPNLRVVARWTRLADDRIDYRFTVEDATAWTRPWSAALAWTTVQPIYEYACHEGNYSLYNILEAPASPRRKRRRHTPSSGICRDLPNLGDTGACTHVCIV